MSHSFLLNLRRAGASLMSNEMYFDRTCIIALYVIHVHSFLPAHLAVELSATQSTPLQLNHGISGVAS